MWTEFEWENRVNVSTSITRVLFTPQHRGTNLSIIHSDLREYLEHIMKSTNVSCLTAEAVLSGDCDFLSANMYARSVFGMSVHVSA